MFIIPSLKVTKHKTEIEIAAEIKNIFMHLPTLDGQYCLGDVHEYNTIINSTSEQVTTLIRH